MLSTFHAGPAHYESGLLRSRNYYGTHQTKVIVFSMLRSYSFSTAAYARRLFHMPLQGLPLTIKNHSIGSMALPCGPSLYIDGIYLLLRRFQTLNFIEDLQAFYCKTTVPYLRYSLSCPLREFRRMPVITLPAHRFS
jgi:hypothetical protein